MRPVPSIYKAVLRRSIIVNKCTCARFYSVGTSAEAARSGKTSQKGAELVPLSTCPENTILVGLNYLKGQAPVLALKDEEYPPWLWNLLKPKVYPDDGPGGKGQKMRLRAANRQRIKEQNFLKTQ